jgi:hypothetical protein
MHLDKIVTVFFIKRVPQYAFRQLRIRTNIDSLLWRNLRIGLCNNLLKKPPDDGNIIAEMRIGALF